jgi:hypothetical protein
MIKCPGREAEHLNIDIIESHQLRVYTEIKMQIFSVKTQVYYLKNQLHVSSIVLYPLSGRSQKYKKKEIIWLQYWSERGPIWKLFFPSVFVLGMDLTMASKQ